MRIKWIQNAIIVYHLSNLVLASIQKVYTSNVRILIKIINVFIFISVCISWMLDLTVHGGQIAIIQMTCSQNKQIIRFNYTFSAMNRNHMRTHLHIRISDNTMACFESLFTIFVIFSDGSVGRQFLVQFNQSPRHRIMVIKVHHFNFTILLSFCWKLLLVQQPG